MIRFTCFRNIRFQNTGIRDITNKFSAYGAGGHKSGTRLANLAGGFSGNIGEPPIDLPAKLKSQSSEFSTLYKTMPRFCLLHALYYPTASGPTGPPQLLPFLSLLAVPKPPLILSPTYIHPSGRDPAAIVGRPRVHAWWIWPRVLYSINLD